MYGLESLCYVTDFLVRAMVVQVQRSAEDSSVVEATYEGEHKHTQPPPSQPQQQNDGSGAGLSGSHRSRGQRRAARLPEEPRTAM